MTISTSWILVIPGTALAGWSSFVAARVWRARRWPAVPGHIAAFVSSVRRSGRSGQPVYSFEVRYRYAVNGVAFEGRRVGFGALDVTPPGGAGPGMPVTVYYDPREPARAVLRRGMPASEIVWGLAGLALAVAGLARSF